MCDSKLRKKVCNFIPIILLGISLVMYFTAISKADEVWSTYALYGDDEDVSDTFQEKEWTDDVYLQIDRCVGGMDFRVVGALEEHPNAYSDCSENHIYRASSTNHSQQFSMYNMVKEWHYTYAGILATSVTDDLSEAKGFFEAN